MNFSLSMHEPRVMRRSQYLSIGRQANSHSVDRIRVYKTTTVIVAYIAFFGLCGKYRRKRTKIDNLLNIIERLYNVWQIIPN